MVEEVTPKPSSRRQKDIIRFLILIGSIILLNIVLASYFFRIDLTEDKRYTISGVTRNMLQNLNQDITIDVYLEGDFPSRFKRLQSGVRETLEEFRVYSDHIQFNFIDPGASSDTEKRNKYYAQLVAKGIQPTNLFATEGDKKVEKLIFPGAIVSSKGKEVPVMLLKGNQAASADERLNQSVEGLEFELATAIRQITRTQKLRIGYIEGHGELPMVEVADFITSTQKNYDVFRVDLKKVPDLKAVDAIIIAKPLLRFSEGEKYKLDQFMINGGNALFLIDPVNIALDSIATRGTVAIPLDLNLQDLLFQYGIRLNGTLIQDINSGQIPMVVGLLGNQPQTQLMNWHYFPIINGFSKHPITRNLDAIYARFISTIDTIKAPAIKKTPLISSSPYSKIVALPARVSLDDARIPPNPQEFRAGPQFVGYLLEGKFKSVFENRPVPVGVIQNKAPLSGVAGTLVVVSDGDLIRNEVNKKTGQPYRLGFDRYTGATFGNKDFASNIIDYMLDEANLISLRSKEIQLRPLDRVRIKEEKGKWQLINIALPLLVLIAYGVLRYYLRKRKYESIN